MKYLNSSGISGKRNLPEFIDAFVYWLVGILDVKKNRQSMTASGYCCCYLEHCSKTDHIAIKGVIQRAKYENVLDL